MVLKRPCRAYKDYFLVSPKSASFLSAHLIAGAVKAAMIAAYCGARSVTSCTPVKTATAATAVAQDLIALTRLGVRNSFICSPSLVEA